jgi:predicted nucleic acid-binding Zn ribbon protein
MWTRRDNTGWKSAAAVLAALLPDLPIASRMKEYQVWEIWEEAVGVSTARKARPSKIQNGKLFVTVSHPAVMQEMQFSKALILRKLNSRLAALDAPLVKALFFVVGRTREMATPPRPPAKLPLPPFSELEVPSLGKPELEAAFASLLAARRRRLKKENDEQ